MDSSDTGGAGFSVLTTYVARGAAAGFLMMATAVMGSAAGFSMMLAKEAIATLVKALQSRDERVAIVAAQALLDRAWGKPKEAKDDDQRQVSVDLSNATTAELQVLLALVQRGALRPVSDPDQPVIVQPASE